VNQHFRTIRLGVPLAGRPVDARNRFGRMRYRTRRLVLQELESRGFTVPG